MISHGTYFGFALMSFVIGFAFILPIQGVNNGLKITQRWARITFVAFEIVAVILGILAFI